ncbi:MAG TPA: hypothetical protein VHE33_18505 [Acidobacteriaceae bacterium]|nr:hypothetical protein [Acidobacteriaceae bacterium]
MAIGITSCQPGNHGPYLSIARLKQIADNVPIPPGVTRISEQSGTSFNGTTGVKSNEDTREFQTAIPCSQLEQSWLNLLRERHRTWTVLSPSPPEHHEIRIQDSEATINIDFGVTYPNSCRQFGMVVDDLK